MKPNFKYILLIILSSIILSCSQKDKIESNNKNDLNENLTIISNKLSNIESVLERVVFDSKTLEALKTNKNILSPIIESTEIYEKLRFFNLESLTEISEKLSEKIYNIENYQNDESKVKIDPFEESIYPVKTRYGTLVLWMKSAQNHGDGIEVKFKILNTLSVGIGDVRLILNADYKIESTNQKNRQSSSLGKLAKIESGEASDLLIIFDGANIQDVNHFSGSIVLTRIYIK